MRVGSRHRLSDARGLNLIEVSVALGVVGLFLAFLFPMLNVRPFNLAADRQDFALQLQVTREYAVSRTLHYRLRVPNGSSNQYVIEQGACTACGGTWTFTTAPIRTITLRMNVAFPAATQGLIAEFDERGQLVTAPATFTLNDVRVGWSKTVTVNTAGMVDTP